MPLPVAIEIVVVIRDDAGVIRRRDFRHLRVDPIRVLHLRTGNERRNLVDRLIAKRRALLQLLRARAHRRVVLIDHALIGERGLILVERRQARLFLSRR